MENTQAIVPQEWVKEEDNMIVELTNEKKVQYCSFEPKTLEEKLELYNVVNTAEKRLSECANMQLKIKGIFVEVVQCISKETGLPQDCPRVVLIGEDGVGYTAVSIGVFSSLKKLMGFLGSNPNEWLSKVLIIPKIITKGDKKITTLITEFRKK